MPRKENRPALSIDEDVIFRQMADSAFDFLSSARSDLEIYPKYAVIHFATAIELILKARLLREHWALTVSVSGEADRKNFQNGTAKTVTLDQSIKRLENIAAEKLPAGAAEAFKVIAAHRNRMIHFFHEIDSSEAEEALRTKVTKELLTGWYYLVQILRNWESYFSEYQEQVVDIENRMGSLRSYLLIAFEKKESQIAYDRESGVEFRNCSSCSYDSAKVCNVDGSISEIECLVCGLLDSMVRFPCGEEGCEGIVSVTSDNTSGGKCDICSKSVEETVIRRMLNTDLEAEAGRVQKNCGVCASINTVVIHEQTFICVRCLAHENSVSMCEWCGEYQLGYDLTDSFYIGCQFCEGRRSWK